MLFKPSLFKALFFEYMNICIYIFRTFSRSCAGLLENNFFLMPNNICGAVSGVTCEVENADFCCDAGLGAPRVQTARSAGVAGAASLMGQPRER